MSAENTTDIPNWISLILEIGVAIFAIVISWKFYNKGKSQHTKTVETLDEIKLVTKQQETKEKFRRIEVLDGIESKLKYCLGSLKYIVKKNQMGFEYSPGFKDECERLTRSSISLDTSTIKL